ncbi:hypothetical protein [Paenibacillus xylanexedens]|nr:hypothetical protein [Paenibacillus xylanexedens]
MNKEASLRLSIAAILLGTSVLINNTIATVVMSLVGLYALITGFIYLKRK